jgi:hypothetical protein
MLLLHDVVQFIFDWPVPGSNVRLAKLASGYPVAFTPLKGPFPAKWIPN